jgi:hypothetical protein
LCSEGGGCGSKKSKLGYDGAYGGIWRSLLLAGVYSGDRNFVGAFGRNMASVALKFFFTFFLVVIKRIL